MWSYPIYGGEVPRNGDPMHLLVLLQAGLALGVPLGSGDEAAALREIPSSGQHVAAGRLRSQRSANKGARQQDAMLTRAFVQCNTQCLIDCQRFDNLISPKVQRRHKSGSAVWRGLTPRPIHRPQERNEYRVHLRRLDPSTETAKIGRRRPQERPPTTAS